MIVVRMVELHHPPVGVVELLIGNVRLDAEHLVGIVTGR